VLCSLNGAAGVERCLTALDRQTIRDSLEVVVVDDGSVDDTSRVASTHDVVLVRHDENRGLAQARNSGVQRATADVVAFLDDDCAPAPDWAESLLAAYDDQTVGVGGPIQPDAASTFFGRFLVRNNPLEPMEAQLGRSDALWFRLLLYLRRQWRHPETAGRRPSYALVGANMSFKRAALLRVGMFDTAFDFGSDDVDVSLRVAEAHPGMRLMYDERPRVVHHFEAHFHDALRRSRGYGRGSARLFLRRGRPRPTIFPLPVIVAALVGRALVGGRPGATLAAMLLPQLWFPKGALTALRSRTAEPLADAYILVAQEAAGDLGVAEGLWRSRRRA
jgi:GT2 family glycosyltransferase